MATTRQRTHFHVPGMTAKDSDQTVAILQERLVALIDLGLTLKHIHWNVVGPHFIGVHEMLDPQVDAVQAMVDATAERIATLGALAERPRRQPRQATAPGTTTPSAARPRSAHLGALDMVYGGVVDGAPRGDREDRGDRPGHARTC